MKSSEPIVALINRETDTSSAPFSDDVCALDARSDFLAQMSHEIRTPLTAILGFSESLLRAGDLVPDQNDAVLRIHRNGEHLLRLVNDVLDLSRIEAGRLPLELCEVQPGELISDTMNLLKTGVGDRRLTLEMQGLNELPPRMRTDPTRVRQILLNLIGNALKFTREGSIHVRASTLEMRGKPFMRIDVQDTGMGMEPGEAAMLFEPFRQADVSIGRRFGGSGLGLAVSRRLARLLGGDLVLLSTVKNEGSTFRLTLPMMATEDAPTIPLEHPTTAPPVVAPAKRAPICLGAQTRVLLAEDCEDIQRLIAGILRRAGADVAVAATGFAAVEIALLAEKTARPFRVILMDMQMPVLDGYEAAKRLRKEGFRRPIIALTACAMTGDRERCLGIGCDDYLSKPIDRILLLETVLKHIS